MVHFLYGSMGNGPEGLLYGLGKVKWHNMVCFLIMCSYYSYCGLEKVNYCNMDHFLISLMVLEGLIIAIMYIFWLLWGGSMQKSCNEWYVMHWLTWSTLRQWGNKGGALLPLTPNPYPGDPSCYICKCWAHPSAQLGQSVVVSMGHCWAQGVGLQFQAVKVEVIRFSSAQAWVEPGMFAVNALGSWWGYFFMMRVDEMKRFLASCWCENNFSWTFSF